MLGKRCNSMKLSCEEESRGLPRVKSTCSFGRKRILILNDVDLFNLEDSSTHTPFECICSFESQKSALESLPQDILIRILCGVNHDDLKQLINVSKILREATWVAERLHFAYSTPIKTRAFQTQMDYQSATMFDVIEAPNAPKQERSCKSQLDGKNLTGISMALFASPRKELFLEAEA